MERFFKSIPKSIETRTSSSSDASTAAQKKSRVEFDPSDIIADPGLRKPIEEYDTGIRDQVRREYLLMGPCQPVGHNFPRKQQGKDLRSFKELWFQKFDWLEYSVEKDAAYCFYCYLFKQPRSDKLGIDSFTKTGFSNWKKAMEVFIEHVGGVNSNHNNARRHCEDFKNQRQSVSHIFSSHSREMEIAYRARVTAVLRVIRFLLLQGLAFRGHDESSSSTNRGNFLEMLNWYGTEVESVGRVIKENAPGNNQMTSPQIQKELVRACAQETTRAIIDEIGDNNFSILLDESRDKSIKEQMAVIVRFVNKQGQVIERFLDVEHVVDTSALSLKTALDGLFARCGLSISRLRGQGYDGASNMRGQFNGLKTLILNENPFAFYVHCFAHQLQLVVVSVARSILAISDFFSYVTMIVNIVGASCKRRDALLQKHHDKIVEKLERDEIFSGRGQHQETNLARPGDTRWGSHYTTLIRLFTMWESVLEVLENVCSDGNVAEQRGMVSGLIQRMESFEFIFILHLMIKVLGLTNDLSNALQQKDQNIVNVMGLIVTVKELMQDLRENGWSTFLEEVKSFCVAMSVSIPNMEDSIPVRGRSRRGGQLVTYYHHYHAEIFIVVIDLLNAEMNNRFSESSTELLRCIACLDPRNSFSKFDHGMLVRLAQIYSDDFSTFDYLILKEQLRIYIHDVRRNSDFSSCHDVASLAVKMVQTDKHLTFPLVYRLIELALILPVATATVERAFSAMNIIKTDLRNKIGNEWLNNMMVCYIEREMFAKIDEETILQCFQNMQNRRIQLPP
ncbi:Ribonuclease H-like protein [Dioscorea alata]|uniref:Ribonuclease H-like protein n=1 Tax=Dioscorea alata TaxID=55571 RepID=A0ACB7WJS9_DIOAL|nr:Ribonuclease H-like protein [Dioscorea alata]